MSEPLSEKALILLNGYNRLREENERSRNKDDRLFTESEHLRAASEQLRGDSDRVTAVYEWLRERFKAMRAALGQESDDD